MQQCASWRTEIQIFSGEGHSSLPRGFLRWGAGKPPPVLHPPRRVRRLDTPINLNPPPLYRGVKINVWMKSTAVSNVVRVNVVSCRAQLSRLIYSVVLQMLQRKLHLVRFVADLLYNILYNKMHNKYTTTSCRPTQQVHKNSKLVA